MQKYKRGQNPNSHKNKPKLGVTPGEVTLTSEQWQLLSDIGQDNRSAGIRELIRWYASLKSDNIDSLFSRLPILGKAKLSIELLLNKHDKAVGYAESVLLELESLEIENILKDFELENGSKNKDVYIA